ncbi:hypothetical protein H0H92_010761 [Tricholoma furcatifolium]|nr:hypothetical protein H0H92_010761 [Tricholoma furcatifolium]
MFEGCIIERMDNDDSKVEVKKRLHQVNNPVEVAQEPESQIPVLQIPPNNPSSPPAMLSTAASSTSAPDLLL